MTVVYIDMVFLLNFIANYLLLLAGGRMAGSILRRGWITLAAGVGALYACVLFLPGTAWLTAWPCKLASGVLMCLAAYGAGRHLLRSSVMFFGASAALAGTVFGAQLRGSGPLTMENGVLYSAIDLRLLLLLFVLCYFILSLFFRRMGRHGGQELVHLELSLLGTRIHIKALRDTGNTLTDPATNRPVIVLDGTAVRHILPREAEPSHPIESAEQLGKIGVKGVRLLPFRAVGTEYGVLLALKADQVSANGTALGSLLVALSPGPVSDGGAYQGLIGGI